MRLWRGRSIGVLRHGGVLGSFRPGEGCRDYDFGYPALSSLFGECRGLFHTWRLRLERDSIASCKLQRPRVIDF